MSLGRPIITEQSAQGAAEALISEFAGRRPLRAGSFIVTLYGDAIVPRGGLVWLGNVIEACGRVGISETLVRTAVSRLVAGGHLVGVREGRRSYYRLTPESLKAFEAAAEVIYGGPELSAGDSWSLLVLPDGSPDEGRRRAFRAQGYGMIAPGLAAKPGPSNARSKTLAERDGVLFQATLKGDEDLRRLRLQASDAWGLHELEQSYGAFVERFALLGKVLATEDLASGLSLPTRLILVQEYRHVVLKDPHLPSVLLPENWPGKAARCLFSRLYLSLTRAADAEINVNFVNGHGPLKPDRLVLDRRLGRLASASAESE